MWEVGEETAECFIAGEREFGDSIAPATAGAARGDDDDDDDDAGDRGGRDDVGDRG